MEIGYVCQNTDESYLDIQTEALKKIGISRIIKGKYSTIKENNIQLDLLFNFLKPKDILVVYRFASLHLSIKQIKIFIDKLLANQIQFKSISENLDSTTEYGQLFLKMMDVFCEGEKFYRSERTIRGLNKSRIRGVNGGRPKGLSPKYESQKEAIKTLYLSKRFTNREIMRSCKIVSSNTYYRILKSCGIHVDGGNTSIKTSPPQKFNG